MNRGQRGGSTVLLSDQIGEEGELVRPSFVRSRSWPTGLVENDDGRGDA